MMKRAFAALLVAIALPALAAQRQKVAVLDVRAVQGVQPGTAQILTAIIAGDTASAGYDVLSQADIGALIGFERQKKMLGCGDDSSCLAEIGGALGAEYVISTQVGQIGSRFHLSLQLLDARKGTVVARVSTFSETTEDALAATAEKAVAQALAAARERTGATAKPTSPSPTSSPTPTPTPTPTSTPTSTSTSTPAATAPATPSKRRFYAEVRVGGGSDKAPIPTSSGSTSFDGPAWGLRGGMTLAPAWALELGIAGRKLRHTKGRYQFVDSSNIPHNIEAQDDVSETFLDATAVWSPAALRWFSFAASLGTATVDTKHMLNPNGAIPGAAPIEEEWRSGAPHLGAELRFDLPVWKLVLGLRLGVDAAKVPAKLKQENPWATTPGPSVAWLESGWVTCVPADLSVRYVF
jgi:hypothetical protein